jgi:DNA-binding FadR family transcriptional regulator
MSRSTLETEFEARIMHGELPAGTKLPSERQLAERYDVSRPIVREVLGKLAERNLVEIMPSRGSFVRGPRSTDAAGYLAAHYRRSQATSRDLVEARTMLESTAAGLAAERATEDDLAGIERALAAFERSVGILDQARYDLAFHLAIARAAANPVIETMFGSITGLALELMLRSLADPEVTQVSVPFHRRIADAIKDRDAAGARRAMIEHLGVASRLYGDDYDRTIDSVAQRELTKLFAPGVSVDDLLAIAGTTTQMMRDGDGRRHDRPDR